MRKGGKKNEERRLVVMENIIILPASSYQMSTLFDAHVANSLDTVFHVAFPLGGAITSIFASMMLERYQNREDIYMAGACL